MISEDRKSDGLWLPQSIASNIAWSKFRGKLGELIRPFWSHRATSTAETFRRSLAIRCDNTQQACQALSGGNQQKVVLAKWLHRDGQFFLFDEPTRGIDAAARETVYEVMRDLCQNGKGLVVVSSDLEELLKVSHRIGVMSNGQWVKEFDGPDFHREEIVAAMFEGYQSQVGQSQGNEVLQ
jgi:ribose transport system ATP-binding protein